MELVITLIIIILMLIVVCFIGTLILAKDTKEFHVNTHTTKVACFQFFINRIAYLPYSS